MTLTIVVACVVAAPWSYGGFADEPGSDRRTAPAVAVPAITVAAPPSPEARRPGPQARAPLPPAPGAGDKPSGPARPAAQPAAIPDRAPSSANRSAAAGASKLAEKADESAGRVAPYRLADASGKVWEHRDPTWLRRWVERCNASIAEAATSRVVEAPGTTGVPSCPSGRCPRIP
jgi:hypothetical protein